MKQKQLIGLAILAGLAYYLTTRNQQLVYRGPYSNIPPPPPTSSPNFQIWVNTILQTFGQVADLWKPGGPFYKQPVPPPPAGSGPVQNPAAPGGIFGNPAPLLFLLPGV